MSLQASAAVGRWWCSPEAVAQPTPFAKARAGSGGDNRAIEIAASPLTTVADVGEAGVAAAAIEAALDGG